MKRQTYSVLFFLKRSKKLRNGLVPVYARITVNGERTQFSCQIEVEESQWDSSNGCVKGNTKAAKNINEQLEIIRMNIRQHKVALEEKGEIISSTSLHDHYKGLDNDRKMVLELFKEHNEKLLPLIGKGYSNETLKRFETCYRHVQNFIKAKYKKNDMDVNDITPRFVSDFEYYFRAERNCNNNTSLKYIKNFKKIIKNALANGWMKKDPFANIRFKWESTNMAFLNEEEFERLRAAKFKNARLQTIKDIYLFCCFTGLAFVDVQHLEPKHIEITKGQYWIRKNRHKTKSQCVIPVLQPAIELIEEYRSHPISQKNNRVFPVPSNQKMNAYLKEIADVCGIDKNLTTHTARHTFATTVTLGNQISIEVVSKMLGHSSINMTKRYARVVDDLINKDMQKLYTKYSRV